MKRCLGFPFIALVAACSGSGTSAPADPPTALVSLARVGAGSAKDELALFGVADPGPGARRSLVAPAEATVAAILAPAGTAVTQGQIIVRLVPSPTTRADATKAAGDAVAANKALARAVRLRSDGLASDADVETARAAATAASAVNSGFDAKLGSLAVRSPASGTIDSVSVVVGDMVQPGAAVASLSRSNEVRARFGVDADTVYRLRTGMAGTIRRGTSAGPAVPVQVQSINPTVDPQTRLSSVYVAIPPGNAIAPGEALTLILDLPSQASALSIPYAALMDDGGQPYVYVVARGVAHRRDVETSPSSGSRVTVTRGLKAGELVVVNGLTGLDDGMKVRTR